MDWKTWLKNSLKKPPNYPAFIKEIEKKYPTPNDWMNRDEDGSYYADFVEEIKRKNI